MLSLQTAFPNQKHAVLTLYLLGLLAVYTYLVKHAIEFTPSFLLGFQHKIIP